MNDAFDLLSGVDDDDRRDLALLHDAQRFDRQRAARSIVTGLRVITSPARELENRSGPLRDHVPPQVAVGDDADQPAARRRRTHVMPRLLRDIS